MTAALQWQQFSYKFNRFFWKGIDLVFPPECPGCQVSRERWCKDCRNSILSITEPVCPICGEPQTTPNVCHDCLSEPPGFDSMRSYTLFDGKIREALHHLKYNRDIGLGEALSPYLISTFQHQNWQPDIVTAIPLGKKRLKERGYNQAALLARPFAAMVGLPYFDKAVQRIIDTRSQINLSATERRENMAGAFCANSLYVNKKSVIIIDDVSTTGSTMSECAFALKSAGAKIVYALAIARAPLKPD